MAKYRKKPVVVEASRWFHNGDHPKDACQRLFAGVGGDPLLSEGKVVRYYRHPNVDPLQECLHCGRDMDDHGWIDTPEGGYIVCPGDWIITGVEGEFYPCKPDIFKVTYERLEEAK